MGITYQTARWVAPSAFAIDFAAQLYGTLTSPNMKDIHDANLSFWSPQPYFIAGIFFPLQLVQIAWLLRLYKLDPIKNASNKKEADIMLDFVPFNAVGNLCLAIWMIFWNAEALKISNIFVLINSLTQLYYMFARLGIMNLSSTSSILTHVVSKTFAGIGVVDVLHNGAAAYMVHESPSTMIKIITAAIFGLLSCLSDWIFGACLVYVLVALAVGQREIGETGWSNLLFAYAVGAAGIVAVKNWIRPPYVKDVSSDYETINEGR